MKGKYYGPNKIIDVKVTESFVILTLDDKKIVKLSPKIAEVAITDKKVDLTELRDKRLQPVAQKILELLLEWDVKLSEIEYINSLVITSLNENLKSADAMLWGVNTEDRTTRIVDKVLKNGKIKTDK